MRRSWPTSSTSAPVRGSDPHDSSAGRPARLSQPGLHTSLWARTLVGRQLDYSVYSPVTRRELLAFSGVSLLLGVLLAVWSTLWPQGGATSIVLLSAGSGLIAAVLVGFVVELFLHQFRVGRSTSEASSRE